MKKVLVTAVLVFMLFGSGNMRAADMNYSGAYTGSMAGSMMTAMWDFMEWFLGQRNNSGPYPGGWNNPNTFYGPNRGPAPNPYRHRDYWDDPSNPWVDMQLLEGTWRAQSGEYWYVRDNRFVLLDNKQQKMTGEFIVEGNFILTRMPWGEVEFEFRQMDDVLVMRDVNGRVMLLRRVEAAGWNW
ncbi:MAG: hypothetical protein ABFS08_06185 [Pseudomonadota bacterium]